jgi:hypothetical protein
MKENIDLQILQKRQNIFEEKIILYEKEEERVVEVRQKRSWKKV